MVNEKPRLILVTGKCWLLVDPMIDTDEWMVDDFHGELMFKDSVRSMDD